MHVNFAWDLANLTTAILEQATEIENADVVDACGRIGRRLLEWVWLERETSESDWYNRFGSHWAVPLVAKTYGTNVEKHLVTLLEKSSPTNKRRKFPDRLSNMAD